ncbi:MAG: glycogen/starch synthase, partial [Bacteroidota bacterium]
MRVLMFGWEYAPQHTGGLGVVCKELSAELSKQHEVTFMLPNLVEVSEKLKKVKAPISADVTRLVDVSQPAKQQLTTAIRKYHPKVVKLEADLLPYLPASLFRRAPNQPSNKRYQTEADDSVKALNAIELTGKYGPQIRAEVTK